jgi:tryptophan synthase alpha chain
MSRIGRTFQRLRRENRRALIAYVTGGYPSLKALNGIARDLERAGVDVLEVGVPFSDPIADGPTIQFSSQKALEAGATLSAILRWAAAFRRSSEMPLVLMSYLNPVHRMGYDEFSRRAAASGVDGLIVPDLVPEEAGTLRGILARRGLDLIHLVAPTTPPERRARVARLSRGFLYAVSVTGVTGARNSLPAEVFRFLKGLRRVSPVPVALGFGISGPEQARKCAPHADGVIVGSAFIERLRGGRPLFPFAKSLRAALDSIPRAGVKKRPGGRA